MNEADGTTAERGRRRRSAKPTVADVARAAGVSLMTVSRVINGANNVLPETRSRVQEAVDALGYIPNLAARTLAGGKQCRVAMVHSNPSAAYLSEFLVGSLAGATQSDAELTIERWDGNETVEALALRLETHRVDAVVLPPPLCEHAALLKALAQYSLPIAQVATALPSPTLHAVMIDDAEAAKAMTEHLIALGHRRIGFVCGDPNQSASALRRRGYEAALEQAGLAVESDLIVRGDFTYRSGLAAGEALLALAERPSAVFASNDDMAAALVAVAHRHHLDVPKDISVCGFDDTAMAKTIWPELTTIRQPIAEMARTAVELLTRAHRIDPTRQSPRFIHRHLPFELIIRGSSARSVTSD